MKLNASVDLSGKLGRNYLGEVSKDQTSQKSGVNLPGLSLDSPMKLRNGRTSGDIFDSPKRSPIIEKGAVS